MIKPEVGQHVKCLLNNGTLVEGTVQTWTNEEVVLLSIDQKSMLILPYPARDIMLIKIVLDDAKSVEPEEKPKVKLPKSDLEQRFEEVRALPSNTPGRTETLAELRIQLAETERSIVTEKLKEHHIGAPGGTKYRNILNLKKGKV